MYHGEHTGGSLVEISNIFAVQGNVFVVQVHQLTELNQCILSKSSDAGVGHLHTDPRLLANGVSYKSGMNTEHARL